MTVSTDYLSEYNFYLSAGDLPPGWTVAPLDDVSTKITDGTHKTPRYQDSGVRFISIKNIRPFKPINFENYEKYISEEEHRQLTKRCKPELGDILFPRIGTMGFAKRIDFKEEVSIFVGLGLIKPDRSLIDERFLEFFMNTRYIANLSAEKANGSGRMTLPLEQTRRFPVPLPPLNEQRRIVEKIETLFARLEKGEEALRDVQKLLARYRQSVLKAAVTGQLTAEWRAENAHRLEHSHDLLARILKIRRETWEGRGQYKDPIVPDTTGLPKLPEGWVWASVDMVTREALIGLVRSAAEQNTVGNGIRYVKMDRVDMNGHLDVETEVRVQASSAEIERYSLAAGDILLNTRNSVELVGKTGIVSKRPHESTVFNNNLMRIRLVSGVLPDFVNFQMCAPPFRKVMEAIKRATTSVAAVYGGDLKALPLALPSPEEQTEICVRLEEKLAQVEAVASWCNTELARSAALRQSILKDAFAGRLVPQDPTDEPAAALLARVRATRSASSESMRRAHE